MGGGGLMIHTIPMTAGTWIYELDNTLRHDSDNYMNVGINSGSQCRPVINFTNTAYSGTILSANLYVYCTTVTNRIGVVGYKVNKAYSAAFCWDVGWATAGCNAVTEDRSNTQMIAAGDIQTTGWTALPIADLTELLALTNGYDTILLVGDDTPTTIAKSPAPYLEIVTLDPSGIIMF